MAARTLKIEVTPDIDRDRMVVALLDACAEACELAGAELRGLAQSVADRQSEPTPAAAAMRVET